MSKRSQAHAATRCGDVDSGLDSGLRRGLHSGLHRCLHRLIKAEFWSICDRKSALIKIPGPQEAPSPQASR